MGLLHCIGVILVGLEAVLAQSNQKWDLKDFKTLVTFGDSYTDDTRISYFINHNGSAPPVGWVEPIVRSPDIMHSIPSLSCTETPTYSLHN